MNHYCTYFDRSFLLQGLTLASSLRQHDAESVLWVLCLDDFTADYLTEIGDDRLRPLPLSALEAADRELCSVKSRRSPVEYYFTLSPCWPRYLLRKHPEIDRITYVDADMFFFSSPQEIFAEMDTASVLVTEHRYPHHLRHHVRFGNFNVGLLSFRNDDVGRDCLNWWRLRCLDWCYDRAENGKYGDQKYLDEWPERYGARLCVLQRRGANLAPWNWSQYRFSFEGDRLLVGGAPLELFHFARFAALQGTRLFQSGQLEYGVMRWRIRQWIYGRYWRALQESRAQVRAARPGFDFAHTSARRWHNFWSALLPRIIFGSDWVRIGPVFISGRLSLGQYSGLWLSWLRTGVRQPLRRFFAPSAAATDSLSVVPVALERDSEAAFATPPQQGE